MFRSIYRNKLRSIFGFTLMPLFFLIFAESAWACLPVPATNYWYKLNYEIPTDLLPPDVEAELTYPAGGTHSTYHEVLGRVQFTNNSAYDLLIVPSDAVYRADQFRGRSGVYARFVVSVAEALDQNTPEMVSVINHYTLANRLIKVGASRIDHFDSAITRDLRSTLELPQSPGGAKPPPAPSEYELVLLHNNQFYRIPLTITYTLNPDYDERKIADAAPLSDYMILSNNVVLGEVIGAAPDSRLLDYSRSGVITDTYVIGRAHVAVEEWTFGEGDDENEIYLGNFATPELECGGTMRVGTRGYFILKGSGSAVIDDDDTLGFGYYTISSRDRLVFALAKSKGVLLDQIMSIFMPILRQD